MMHAGCAHAFFVIQSQVCSERRESELFAARPSSAARPSLQSLHASRKQRAAERATSRLATLVTMLSRGQGHADTDAKVPLLPRGPMLNSNNSSLASTPSAAPINLSVGATVSAETKPRTASRRLTSLDVFRGLTVVLMVFVDDAGGVLPSIDHEPWNGLRSYGLG